MGSKATNKNKENKLLYFCLRWGLNQGPFSSESSVMPSEPAYITDLNKSFINHLTS